MEGSGVGRSWEARAFTYGSVFILQAGAGDGAAIQKDLALGRGHLPTPLELVVQQRILLKDEPSHLPVVDNVTLRTDRRALSGEVAKGTALCAGRGVPWHRQTVCAMKSTLQQGGWHSFFFLA